VFSEGLICTRHGMYAATMKGNNCISLTQALVLYREQNLVARNLATKTCIEYTNDLENLIAFLQERLLIGRPDQVECKHLERYLAMLERRGFLSRTRRRKVASFRSFFGFLEEQGIVGRSPAHQLIPPMRQEDQPRILSGAECKQLFDSARVGTRDVAIVALLLHTGIRLSECAGVTLDDIVLPDLTNRDKKEVGSVKVVSRSRSRVVMLNQQSSEAIGAYLKVRPVADVRSLFVTKFKRGIGPRSIENLVTKHLREAGIYDASVHSLRHTAAICMVKRGTKLDVVRKALGHSSVKTTSIYVDLAREVTDQALQANTL